MSETTRDGRGPVRIPAPAGVFPAARTRQVSGNARRRPAAARAGSEDVTEPAYLVTHMPGERLPASSAVRVAPEFPPETEAPPPPKGVGALRAVVAG
ncbi:hypothetical protein [Streptomyces sp. NPDC046870]|uniref:hypothetical protein n=1 Tax=Streptomyces sp. NPDC046870 TaxID=3155135 RepID=UPI003456CD90